MSTPGSAVSDYVNAYDEYQLLFAKYPLRGWGGDIYNAPAEVDDAYERMQKAFIKMRIEFGFAIRNYATEAKRQLEEET